MEKISSHCREDRIDHLWTQMLRHYFPLNDEYGIEKLNLPEEDLSRHVGYTSLRTSQDASGTCTMESTPGPTTDEASADVLSWARQVVTGGDLTTDDEDGPWSEGEPAESEFEFDLEVNIVNWGNIPE